MLIVKITLSGMRHNEGGVICETHLPFINADLVEESETWKQGPPKRHLVSDFKADSIETEGDIRKRLSRIYEKIRPLRGKEAIQEFVFNCGFDADGGLGAGLNQSSVDFILWLAASYHELIHLFRCGARGKDQVERMAKTLYGKDGFSTTFTNTSARALCLWSHSPLLTLLQILVVL